MSTELRTKSKKANKMLGELLKEIRNGKEVTMRSLAAKLGTPHSFVGKIEQQTRRMDVGEFMVYCKALGQDPTAVFNTLFDTVEADESE